MSAANCRSNKPLTPSGIENWISASQHNGFEDLRYLKRRRVDPRLFRISHAFAAVIECTVSVGPRTALVPLAKRALNSLQHYTPDGALDFCRGDGKRVNVVIDWLVRYVLPNSLSALPTWSEARNAADQLRRLQEMFWVNQMVIALREVMNIVLVLEAEKRGFRVADVGRPDILNHHRVHAVADGALSVLAKATARQTSNPIGNDRDVWLSRIALLASEAGFKEELAAALPPLVDVLCAVDPNDSQQTAADRCKWPSLAKPSSSRPPRKKVANPKRKGL